MQSSNESQKQAERIFCLVVPTYNESDNIGTLIERIENQVPTLHLRLVLLFVDDNSEDGTADIIKRYMEKFRNILLLQRPKLAGLGSAYIDGFKYALREMNAEFLGEMDADLQHPPET
ncbi:MAG TPA: glycosyltransferase, partial [Nitrososphaerales archaeon]|nr:glycosyltransferase [Nitrososphaerales archaeon]